MVSLSTEQRSAAHFTPMNPSIPSLPGSLSRALLRSLRAITAAGLLLAGLTAASHAALIYGSAYIGNFDSAKLYTINSTNGASTLVGGIGFYEVGGMDFDSGTLYGTGRRISDSANVLISINTATGAGTEIGLLGFGSNVSDISFRSDHTLFAYAGSDIYTINKVTGAATLVGTPGGGSGKALAFSSSGTLYTVNSGFAATVNQTTGAVTNGAAMNYAPLANGSTRANGMDFDASGTLWASVFDGNGGGVPAWLATIDVSTGNVSYVGTTVRGMDALAIQEVAPVPEPGSMGVLVAFALGAVALLGRAPRRKVA